jgi:hypothetical protein
MLAIHAFWNWSGQKVSTTSWTCIGSNSALQVRVALVRHGAMEDSHVGDTGNHFADEEEREKVEFVIYIVTRDDICMRMALFARRSVPFAVTNDLSCMTIKSWSIG